MKKQKIIAILPAYNAEKTFVPFFRSLPKHVFDEIILVDDFSSDRTFEIVKKERGIVSYRNLRNLGYGGNLKTCLGIALEHNADVIVELHPDGEYGFNGIKPAVEEIRKGTQFVLGNRFSSHYKTGMYLHKYIFNRLLTLIDNLVLGSSIPDLHQGFRVYTKDLLNKVNFRTNSDNYLFSFEIISQAIFHKISIASVPVNTFYRGKKRGASLKSSIVYSIGTFKVLGKLLLAKLGLKIELFMQPRKKAVCPNCGFSYLVYSKSSRSNLFFCDICQNGFLSPFPTNIDKYYPQNYWNYQGFLGIIRHMIFKFAQGRRKKFVKEFLKKGASILDVGSGEGNFGKTLGKEFEITNIEATFSKIKNKNVLKTDFLKWNTNKKFDAICFWESLEHVPSPQLYLEKAYKLLNKDGLVFIECPRYNGFESKIFGTDWFHLDIPRHFSHFTDQGLVTVLSRAGFSKVSQNPILALEYGPAGLFLSLKNAFKIMFILLVPLLIPILIIELLTGDYPIGLTVGRKE